MRTASVCVCVCSGGVRMGEGDTVRGKEGHFGALSPRPRCTPQSMAADLGLCWIWRRQYVKSQGNFGTPSLV